MTNSYHSKNTNPRDQNRLVKPLVNLNYQTEKSVDYLFTIAY